MINVQFSSLPNPNSGANESSGLTRSRTDNLNKISPSNASLSSAGGTLIAPMTSVSPSDPFLESTKMTSNLSSQDPAPRQAFTTGLCLRSWTSPLDLSQNPEAPSTHYLEASPFEQQEKLNLSKWS